MDKIVDKLVAKIKRVGLFESDEDGTYKDKFIKQLKETINIDKLSEKFDEKLGSLPNSLRSILCDKVQNELRY